MIFICLTCVEHMEYEIEIEYVLVLELIINN